MMHRFWLATVFEIDKINQSDYADFGKYRSINPLAIESIKGISERFSVVRMISGDEFAVEHEMVNHLERGFDACLR